MAESADTPARRTAVRRRPPRPRGGMTGDMPGAVTKPSAAPRTKRPYVPPAVIAATPAQPHFHGHPELSR